MTEPDSIGTASNQLRDAIAEFQLPTCDPLTLDRDELASEGTIRRGHEQNER